METDMTTYWIFERTDDSTKVIAVIQKGEVLGPKAEWVEELLRDNGWPEIAPKKILHGSRIWAADNVPDVE